MIPNAQRRDVRSGGVTESTVFGISTKDAAHIMTILRDTLYSDKVLAVLREYSSNAWDAHREVGKDTLPIEVTMPTSMQPTLGIRDRGPGLSHQAVFEVYTQYGASTKRDNDHAVGMLGIGSKSGFAYSDTFNITSWHEGTKRLYTAVLDDTDKGVINLLHEEDCGDETGILVEIAIRNEDIWEFQQKARELFQYFRPRPTINLDLPPAIDSNLGLTHGYLWKGSGEWTAVMGCVPYRINTDQLRTQGSRTAQIGEHLHQVDGALFFDIGEVQINASREELKYTSNTKSKIVEKMHALVDEYIQLTLDALEKDNLTPWEKRLRAQVFHTLSLPIPVRYLKATEARIELEPQPLSFVVTNRHYQVRHIDVDQNTRLLWKDDSRELSGFNLRHDDYLLTPIAGVDPNYPKLELEVLISTLNLRGIQVENLSSVSWAPPYKKGKTKNKNFNAKHHRKAFVLSNTKHFHHPWSSHWSISDHVPSDDDVFVILSGFETVTYRFYHCYTQDAKLAEIFKGTMPPIYGYKTTAKKPLTPQDCKGTEYPAWRKTFIQSLMSPKISKLVERYRWYQISTDSYSLDIETRKKDQGSYTRLIKALGDTHPISRMVQNLKGARRVISSLSRMNRTALEDLVERLDKLVADTENPVRSVSKTTQDAVIATYPLLGEVGMDVLWGKSAEKWVDYVQLIDNTNHPDPFRLPKKL